MRNKRNKTNRIKRPSKYIYLPIAGLISLYAALFKKHRIISRLPKDIKPPFIIIGNHTSFYDFVYAIRSFFPKRINFVVARKYFHFSGLRPILKLARAIPKSLYQADVSTVVAMLKILKQGGVLGLYPEGQISIHGVTIENGESIAKFIKKSEVAVVRILTGGAYLTNPPWAKTSRTGPIESRVNIVLSKEQIRELSEEEILLHLQDSIYINTYVWQETKGYTYSGKNLAEGLENILYLCPGCGSEFTITTKGDEVICESCGIRAGYGKDGHFHWVGKDYFSQLEDWHLWQLKHEKAAISSDNNFNLSEQLELAMLCQKGTGVEVVGSGVFTACRDAYHYNGTLNQQEVHLTFPTSGIRYFPFDTGRNFQIYSKNQYYEFRPANPRWCMKIANICEGLYEQNY